MIHGTELSVLVVAFAAGVIVPVVTTPAGISGAVILLPFQLVVLGLSGPAVSATTLLYNVIAMPAGIWRYRRAGRLSYPLVGAIALGSLPGVIVGVVLRTTVIANTAVFEPLLGGLLTALALHILWRAWRSAGASKRPTSPSPAPPGAVSTGPGPGVSSQEQRDETSSPTRRRVVGALAFLVGVLSGVFGIGGGSFMAPALKDALRWPVRMIAGATLFSTFLTSLTGLPTFILLGALISGHQTPVYPYWGIGIALGSGGIIGSQLGVVLHVRLSERILTVLLGVLLLVTGLSFLFP